MSATTDRERIARPAGPLRRRAPVLHPFLFAAFPALFLFARNLREDIPVGDLAGPLGVSLVGSGVAFAMLHRWLRDVDRAGLATSVLVILVFSFGHVQRTLDPTGYRGTEVPLLLAWLAIALITLFRVRRSRSGPPRLTGGLNVLAGALVLLNLATIVRGAATGAMGPRAGSEPPPRVSAPAQGLRDIYYVIFDRYAGERTLRDQYGFDNLPMVSWLAEQGFHVVPDALANYPKTTHSLASSLNMTYLDDLASEVGRDSGDWGPLQGSLQGSTVATVMKSLGYRYHHIGTWWRPSAVDPIADENHVFGPSEFSGVLLETTIIPAIARRIGLGDAFDLERREYRRALFQFEELDRIAADPDPTFTFAHFTLPHPPYVFDAEGRFVEPVIRSEADLHAAYLEQLRYTNERIRQLVTRLLAGPNGTDPIVILQSDEGPHPIGLERDEDGYSWTTASDADLERKLRILNAYYLPGLPQGDLGDRLSGITPVNSFRLILSLYFGADMPLLPDRTYVYESQAHPYRFTDVTERVRV